MLPYGSIEKYFTAVLILFASLSSNHAASTRADDVNLIGVPGPYSFGNFCRLKTNELWAVGGNGTVQYHNKAGSLERRVTEESLNGVYFVNSRVGWVVGDSGNILHTEDQGHSWNRQISGVKQSLRAIKCTNENRCWAVGGAGIILSTGDSGQHWEERRSNLSADLFAVDFVDDQVGWVTGEDGLVLHTNDGGQLWETQRAVITLFPNGPFTAPTDLVAVKFTNRQVGWVAGAGGIASTVDGGKTWEPREIQDSSFIGLVSNDGNTVWAISSSGSNYITKNSGKTWGPTVERTLAKQRPKRLNQLSSMVIRRRRHN